MRRGESTAWSRRGSPPGQTENIWFTEFNTNQIGMINTDTDQITEFPVITPGA